MPIDFESTSWGNLRGELSFGTTLAGYPEPRDRAVDVRMRQCGNRWRIFHENTHSVRNDPIHPGKLSTPGAAASSGQRNRTARRPAEPSGHGACESPNSQAAVPETPAAEMSPVNGELVSKLDSKTAKTGDSVVVQTKASVKTADGTEIPKGSKLVGRVLGVHPSEAGENSQVALQFDHVELKGGQSVAVHSQIQSIAPAGGAASRCHERTSGQRLF